MSVIPTSGVNWGFQASDLFSNGQALFASVAGFVLLALAFPVGRKFIGFIMSLFKNRA